MPWLVEVYLQECPALTEEQLFSIARMPNLLSLQCIELRHLSRDAYRIISGIVNTRRRIRHSQDAA